MTAIFGRESTPTKLARYRCTALLRVDICNVEGFSLTTLMISLLPVCQQTGGVNVSVFAVGDCCGCPAKGAVDRG